MTKEEKLIRQYKMVIDTNNKLSIELGKLNAMVIKITGIEDLWADIANGDDIEFHDEKNGGIGKDSFTLIIEDVLQILRKEDGND